MTNALRNLVAVLAITALLFPATKASGADAPFSIERLMGEIAQASVGEAAFRETRYSSALKAPLESSGVLRFKRPDFLEKQVNEPYFDRFAVEGDRVTLERSKGAKPITISLASQPVLQAFIESIRGTLRGDLATLRRYYRVELEGVSTAWTVVLLPTDVDVGGLVRMIRIGGRGSRMLTVEVQEASGDRSLLRIVDPKTQ